MPAASKHFNLVLFSNPHKVGSSRRPRMLPGLIRAVSSMTQEALVTKVTSRLRLLSSSDPTAEDVKVTKIELTSDARDALLRQLMADRARELAVVLYRQTYGEMLNRLGDRRVLTERITTLASTQSDPWIKRELLSFISEVPPVELPTIDPVPDFGAWEVQTEDIITPDGHDELYAEDGAMVLLADGKVVARVSLGETAQHRAYVLDAAGNVRYAAEIGEDEGADLEDGTMTVARKWCEDMIATDQARQNIKGWLEAGCLGENETLESRHGDSFDPATMMIFKVPAPMHLVDTTNPDFWIPLAREHGELVSDINHFPIGARYVITGRTNA